MPQYQIENIDRYFFLSLQLKNLNDVIIVEDERFRNVKEWFRQDYNFNSIKVMLTFECWRHSSEFQCFIIGKYTEWPAASLAAWNALNDGSGPFVECGVFPPPTYFSSW